MFSPILFWIIKSLWHSDVSWRHRSGSILPQVMAWCLTAPSHYLNQRWLFISKFWWQSHEGNCTRDIAAINYSNQLQIYLSKISYKSLRGQWIIGGQYCQYGGQYCVVSPDWTLDHIHVAAVARVMSNNIIGLVSASIWDVLFGRRR